MSVRSHPDHAGPGVDPRLFRRTLGRFLTGVTVVTAADRTGRRWGMTANSFTSVSLAPPLVSVCISRKAGSFAALHGCAHFGVSILSESQEDLARGFASPVADKFTGVALLDGERRAPVLAGASAWLLCSVYERVPAGDHVMLIGRVERCDFSGRPPLGYCEGSFLTLGPPPPAPAPGDAEAAGAVPGRGREIFAGWLVEQDGKVAMARRVVDGREEWELPSGRLAHGRTHSDSLDATAKAVLGADVEPDFLYSVIDLAETRTCNVYRARPLARLAEGDDLRLFGEDEIPWEAIPHSSVRSILTRYFAERLTDRFGVFLNVGRGRIAHISSAEPWEPS